MSGTVQVTVAPGCHFQIAPHPSGLPGLPPLVLHGGNTAIVSALRAEDLYAAGLILHPVTGELPPPPVAMSASRPTMQIGSAPRRDLTDTLLTQPTWATTAEPPNTEPSAGPKIGSTRPGSPVRFNELFAGQVQITDDDGQPWPNY